MSISIALRRQRQREPAGDSLVRARPAETDLAERHSASALAAAVLGFFVITLDVVVVNVALPSIRDAGAGGGDLGDGRGHLRRIEAGAAGFATARVLAALAACS